MDRMCKHSNKVRKPSDESNQRKLLLFLLSSRPKICRTFGEVRIMSNMVSKIKNKLYNRGREGIFMGYANEHPGDVYRMLHMKTGKINLLRDTTWKNKIYDEYYKVEKDDKQITSEYIYN